MIDCKKPYNNGHVLQGSLRICCPEDEGGCGHVFDIPASSFHAVESTEDVEGPVNVILVYEASRKDVTCPQCNANFGEISVHIEHVDCKEIGREIRSVAEFGKDTLKAVLEAKP